jgi:hypothetical protein
MRHALVRAALKRRQKAALHQRLQCPDATADDQ